MIPPQRPIGSGFGARSTAADVTRGIDLTGRLAIVTGGYSGIGVAHFGTGYDKWLAYGQSKTANALFTRHLGALGVRAFSVHPGAILTPLQRHVSRAEQVAAGWVDADGNPEDPTFKTPAQGAATAVWAATSPQLDGLGGAYLENCDVAAPTDRADMVSGVSPHATDPDRAARLRAFSADLTGLDSARPAMTD